MENTRELEKILKALANKRRLAILKYLKNEGETSVGDIANKIKLSFKSTSRHLSVLFAVDIIEKDQKGLQVFYGIAGDSKPAVKAVLSLL